MKVLSDLMKLSDLGQIEESSPLYPVRQKQDELTGKVTDLRNSVNTDYINALIIADDSFERGAPVVGSEESQSPQ